MSEFSIERNIENIYNCSTKDYFLEVYKSYSFENYRSATVMLYSVVICDLIYKLQELKDKYQDTVAKEILEEIEACRKADDTNPKWESRLIELIKERTYLLENADYFNILNLQKHRHLSAHPTLDQNYLLFSPNKDVVRAHIRNMLEGVLLRPPIFSKLIITEILKDLAQNKDIFLDNKSNLKKYLEAKYFKGLHKETEKILFRAFWKLTFRTVNLDCDKNRSINFKTIKIIFEKNPNYFLSLIYSDSSYFSNISGDLEVLSYLIEWLSNNKEIYDLLNDEAKEIIIGKCKENDNLYLLSWFIEDDFTKHIANLSSYIVNNSKFDINSRPFNLLLEVGKELDCTQDVLELGILIFSNSRSFDSADERFISLIKPNLQLYDKRLMLMLLGAIESNKQIHCRGRMVSDSPLVKNSSDILFGSDFNYSQFPNFLTNYNEFTRRESGDLF